MAKAMEDDPFVRAHDASELEIAGEFLTNWLPFLTRDLCDRCSQTLAVRIRSLHPDPPPAMPEYVRSNKQIDHDRDPNRDSVTPDPPEVSPSWDEQAEPSGWGSEPEAEPNPDLSSESPKVRVGPSGWGTEPEAEPNRDLSSESLKVRMSWADMAQEDELAEEEERARERSEAEGVKKKVELPREQREWIRFKSVGRKKDFICLERVKGKIVNILDGLELHTGVFSAAEQKRIVDFIYELEEKGRRSEFGERTYTEPQKWMRGKGRVTIQFGCCYNYAVDKDGNPPGILRNIAADPIPSLFRVIIRRLVRWHVLPMSCVPDSCIVNIYEPGDCIPPHIDSHDFVRPFTTVSFLSECNIVFGTSLKVEGAGEFSGATAIPLPVGSVLVLNGNGADIAKHCVPAVPTKRISITFRKMDEAKQPIGFSPEPDLQNIQPLPVDSFVTEYHQGDSQSNQQRSGSRSSWRGSKYRGKPAAGQYRSHDSETPPIVRTRQVVDARFGASTDNSLGGAREPAGRSFDSKSISAPHEVRRLWDEGDKPIRRSPRVWADEGSNHADARMELNGSGRRVRVDQERIVISRTVERDEDVGLQSADQDYHSQSPYRPSNSGRRRVKVVVADV